MAERAERSGPERPPERGTDDEARVLALTERLVADHWPGDPKDFSGANSTPGWRSSTSPEGHGGLGLCPSCNA